MSALAPDSHGGYRDALIGLYGMILGLAMYFYETRLKLTARDLSCFRRRFPSHAFIYFACALPLFVARGTILAGVFMIVQTAVYVLHISPQNTVNICAHSPYMGVSMINRLIGILSPLY
jgi:hypothetical protein